MRIEELMAQVQQTLAEGGSLIELEEPIQAVLDVTEENLERFLADTEADSEMPAETRDQLREALESCLDALEGMQDALPEGSEAVQRQVDQTLEKVKRVRSLQLEHEASLSAGPTTFAFVNRLLTRDLAGTRMLLQDRFSFLQLLRDELALRMLAPRDSQVLFDLQAVLDRDVQDLPAFQADLLTAAGRLEPLLSRPAHGRASGLLSVLGLERLVTLLKEYQGKLEEGVESALTRCRSAVQQSVPPSSPPAALQALSKLLSRLDLVQEDLQEAPQEYAEIRGHAEALAHLGQELQRALVVAPGPQSYRAETEGLPIIFRSVLEPAYAFLEGRGDANLVFAASQHLQVLLDQMDENEPEPAEQLEEALQVLSEAIEALQAVAGTGGPLQMELATELCWDAAAKLKAAGIRLKEA